MDGEIAIFLKGGAIRCIGAVKSLAWRTFWVQIGAVKRSIDLDDELMAEVDQAAALIREKPATVMRLALRAGLASVTNRFQSSRPERYFEDAYRRHARAGIEDAAGKALRQTPER